MRQFALQALKLYERYPYARVNMVAAVIGGSYQRRRKEIAEMARGGLLRLHAPKQHWYPSYWHRIHSLPSTKNKFNFHDVMLSDIMLSIEAAILQEITA